MQVQRRMDGRIEIQCEHGVGHPSKMLTEAHGTPWDVGWMGVHGCDGCCYKVAFQKFEWGEAREAPVVEVGS